MAKYLDYDRLDRFLTKLKLYISAGISSVSSRVSSLENLADSLMHLKRKTGDYLSQTGVTTNYNPDVMTTSGLYKINSQYTGVPLNNGDYGFMLVLRDDNRMVNQLVFNKAGFCGIREIWLDSATATTGTATAWRSLRRLTETLDFSHFATAPTVTINRINKSGDTVSIWLEIKLNEAVPDYGKIATIPGSCVPYTFEYFHIWNGMTPVVAYMQANGAICIRKSGGLASGTTLQGFVTYVSYGG